MKVTFVGNGKNDPAEIVAYGHTFPLREPVDVEVDEETAMKLRGNSHFVIDEEEPLDREALLTRAQELGITIRGNMKVETIAAKIAEKEAE